MGWIKGRLEPNSAAFHDLFQNEAALECVATGFRFTEGPVWIPEEQALLWSDIPDDKILKLIRGDSVVVFRSPSGNSNGLTLDLQGRLLACEHGPRRVTRTEKDGTITVLAEQFEGCRLNSPNDLIAMSDGAIYFTDPPFGIRPSDQEISFQGVFRLSPDGRELRVVAEDFDRPNGLAFSPDEASLYIDDSARRHIRVFSVRPNGDLDQGRLFFDMNVPKKGSPDGMKVDAAGRLFCTGPGGVWVFSPDGTHLGTIVTPETPSNCAWGEIDSLSLFITAETSVYRIRLKTPGAGPPWKRSRD